MQYQLFGVEKISTRNYRYSGSFVIASFVTFSLFVLMQRLIEIDESIQQIEPIFQATNVVIDDVFLKEPESIPKTISQTTTPPPASLKNDGFSDAQPFSVSINAQPPVKNGLSIEDEIKAISKDISAEYSDHSANTDTELGATAQQTTPGNKIRVKFVVDNKGRLVGLDVLQNEGTAAQLNALKNEISAYQYNVPYLHKQDKAKMFTVYYVKMVLDKQDPSQLHSIAFQKLDQMDTPETHAKEMTVITQIEDKIALEAMRNLEKMNRPHR